MSNEWCVAAYLPDGTAVGWATRITSIVQLSRKAERFTDKAAAHRLLYACEHSWLGYQYLWLVERWTPDVDIRTENAATALDSAAHMGLPSSSSQREPTMPTKKQTKQQPKPQPAKSPKSPSAQPTKLLPAKPVMRTTASARLFTACLCGCSNPVKGNLQRGHYKRLEAKLNAIKNGTLTPEQAFGVKLAKAWGPWKATRTGQFTSNSYAQVRANLG